MTQSNLCPTLSNYSNKPEKRKNVGHMSENVTVCVHTG